jgi:hypothetical protein
VEIPDAEWEATLAAGRVGNQPLSTGKIIREHFDRKRGRLASLERMAAELRDAGWTVLPPDDD